MKQEKLKSTLKLKFLPGTFNISELSKELFTKLDVADGDQNKINMDKLRLGSLGAYIEFENDSGDEINVNSSSIEIESYSNDRISDILKVFKSISGKTEILSGEFVVNRHYIDKGLPDKILHSYSVEESYATEIIQLKKGKDLIQLYQCGSNILHIKNGIQLKNRALLKDMDLENAFNYSKEEEIFQQFIDLKITS